MSDSPLHAKHGNYPRTCDHWWIETPNGWRCANCASAVGPEPGLAGLLNQATPGPWQARTDGMFPVVTKSDSYAPVMEFAQYGKDGQPEAAVNARIVALAPEMAALLIDAMGWFSEYGKDGGCDLCGELESENCTCGLAGMLARFDQLNHKAAP